MSSIKYYASEISTHRYIRFVMPDDLISAYRFEHKDRFSATANEYKIILRYDVTGNFKLSKLDEKFMLSVKIPEFSDETYKLIRANSSKNVPFIVANGAMIIDMTKVATLEKGFHIQPKGSDLLGMVANS